MPAASNEVYTYFMVNLFGLSIDKMDWLDCHLQHVEKAFIVESAQIDDPYLAKIAELFAPEDFFYPEFDVRRNGNDYIFHSGKHKNANPRQLARLLHEYLIHFDSDETIKFRWVRWCNGNYEDDDAGIYWIDKNQITSISMKEMMSR